MLTYPPIFIMNYRSQVKLLLAIAACLSCLLPLPQQSSIAQASCNDQEIRDRDSSTGRTWYVCDYSLSFQSDGNLVLSKRGANSQVLWASGTDGQGNKFSVQSDGNVVIYDRNNAPIWATNTSGNSGAFLALQNDGNLVVYTQSRQPIFATNTSRGQANAGNSSNDFFQGLSTLFGSNSNNTNSSSSCFEQAKKASLFDRDAKDVCTNATPYVGECVQQAKRSRLFDRDAVDVCRNATSYVAQCIQRTKTANFFDRDAVSVCRNASIQTVQCVDSGLKANSFSSKIVDTCRNTGNSNGQFPGQVPIQSTGRSPVQFPGQVPTQTIGQ
jgi:hypothetical protein